MRAKIFFTHVFIIALFSSRLNAQTPDLVKYLPEKAAMIMDIDGSSLSQKLSWKELMAMKMFDSLLKKAEPGTRKMIAEPAETGINFREHLYFVINFNEQDENNSGNYIAIYGKVDDEYKLSQLLNKAADKETTRKTSGENKMLLGKDFLFGWNKSVFVLHTGTAFFKEFETSAKQSRSQKKKEIARLEKKCIGLLTPNAKNIYTTNKYFENLVTQKADVRIWLETAMLNSLRKGKNPFAMFNMNSDYQGKYKTAVINFENGKVVSKGYTYYDDYLSDPMQKMYSKKLNTELIKKVPDGNLLGLFAMSFNPDAIEDFITKTGIWDEFKKIDEESDFDPKALLDNLKGDIMMAVSMPETPEEGSDENPFAGMQIYLAATIKDDKKMNQFIDSIKTLIEEKKKSRYDDEGLSDTTIMEKAPIITFPDSLTVLQDSSIVMDEEIYVPQKNDMFKNMKPAIRVENGLFLLSLSDAHLSQFGAASTTAHDKLIAEYGNYPMLMMIDLKTILSIAMSTLKMQDNPETDPEMYSFFEVFDKWVIAGGKFENGAMQTTQEIKFSNPDENSLKQVMKMFDLIFSAFTRTKVKDIEVKEN